MNVSLDADETTNVAEIHYAVPGVKTFFDGKVGTYVMENEIRSCGKPVNISFDIWSVLVVHNAYLLRCC